MLLKISFNLDSNACHSTFHLLIRATLARFNFDFFMTLQQLELAK